MGKDTLDNLQVGQGTHDPVQMSQRSKYNWRPWCHPNKTKAMWCHLNGMKDPWWFLKWIEQPDGTGDHKRSLMLSKLDRKQNERPLWVVRSLIFSEQDWIPSMASERYKLSNWLQLRRTVHALTCWRKQERVFWISRCSSQESSCLINCSHRMKINTHDRVLN